MALRDIAAIPYAPVLELRPAEMLALESLPGKDKDLILPIFKLGPWGASHELDNSINRITQAYGRRPCVLALGDVDPRLMLRPVHQRLSQLASSQNGYANWCNFFTEKGNEGFIPCAQIANASEFDIQVGRLWALDRGLCLYINSLAMPFVSLICSNAAKITSGGSGVLVVLDFGKITALHSRNLDFFIRAFSDVRQSIPHAKIVFCGSSFPDMFTNISNQDIFEREIFGQISVAIGSGLIYGDRGSARSERQVGGSGQPAPRIDYPLDQQWNFHRSSAGGDRADQYETMARNLVAESYWDPALRVWGTQMIERTALGDTTAITSPARSTAVRINIHLHRQLHYGDHFGLYDTEDEWVDSL